MIAELLLWLRFRSARLSLRTRPVARGAATALSAYGMAVEEAAGGWAISDVAGEGMADAAFSGSTLPGEVSTDPGIVPLAMPVPAGSTFSLSQ